VNEWTWSPHGVSDYSKGSKTATNETFVDHADLTYFVVCGH
jgi:hypothetical protein